MIEINEIEFEEEYEEELTDYQKYYEYHQHQFTDEELEVLPLGILDEYRFDLFQDLDLRDSDSDDDNISWLIEQYNRVIDAINKRFNEDRPHL